MPNSSAFNLTPTDLLALLDPSVPFFPELEAARSERSALRETPQAHATLAWTDAHMDRVGQMPETRYTDYRAFLRTGDRKAYETPYFARRAMLAGTALRLFFGDTELKDPLQDLIWAVCEESNWVLPAHERGVIDLFSAETAFMLAETLALLEDDLDAEVRSRVRFEVERRVFQPYLAHYSSLMWYQCHHNWNGVCNSSVAAAFLLLEPEPGRAAQGLSLALRGLKTYLETAFESDGSSTEGVSYWNYGLINFVALAEMLRARSKGRIDLLDSEHMRQVAAYPAKLLLSPSRFASFSDCDDLLNFNPGMISRLMERTGERSLEALLAPPVPSERQWRLTMMLRDILWWDGQYQRQMPWQMPEPDSYLRVGQLARLVARTPRGVPVTAAIKAGHNGENHNHNDIGSFILHIGEESFLVDPGRGLYSRQYFGPERYQNIFANAYAHSVPVIGGLLQKEGAEYEGEMVEVQISGTGDKWAEVEMAGAYPASELDSLRRRVSLSADGIFTLSDTFTFRGAGLPVEEACVTWCEVDVEGSTALLHGAQHVLRLTIEAPAGACFQVERLEEACRENQKPGVLKRLTITLPPAPLVKVQVRAEVD
jgi:hypothetical protein